MASSVQTLQSESQLLCDEILGKGKEWLFNITSNQRESLNKIFQRFSTVTGSSPPGVILADNQTEGKFEMIALTVTENWLRYVIDESVMLRGVHKAVILSDNIYMKQNMRDLFQLFRVEGMSVGLWCMLHI